MADNLTLNNSGATGTIIAADDIGGVHYPRGKVGFGADGSYTDVSSSAPLPVKKGAAGLCTLSAAAAKQLRATLDNDGSTFSAVGNWSGGQGRFEIKPAAGTHILAYALQVVVSIAEADFEGFHNYFDISALSNGVRVTIRDLADDSAETYLTDPIKTVTDWACYGDVQSFSGANRAFVRITIPLAVDGMPIDIASPSSGVGDYLSIDHDDNLSSAYSTCTYTLRAITLTDAEFAAQALTVA